MSKLQFDVSCTDVWVADKVPEKKAECQQSTEDDRLAEDFVFFCSARELHVLKERFPSNPIHDMAMGGMSKTAGAKRKSVEPPSKKSKKDDSSSDDSSSDEEVEVKKADAKKATPPSKAQAKKVRKDANCTSWSLWNILFIFFVRFNPKDLLFLHFTKMFFVGV
jgi:hypothetical protein